eukprot:scaffold46996_cov60-Phaeocystis_antarctica.AAC.1
MPQHDPKRVEVRRLRRPEPRLRAVPAHAQRHRHSRHQRGWLPGRQHDALARGRSEMTVGVTSLHAQQQRYLGADGDHGAEGDRGEVCRDDKLLDVRGGGHRLEPDALPDAARPRVEDALGLRALLSAQLRAVCRVKHAHKQRVDAARRRRGRLHRLGDLEGKGREATSMITQRHAVEPNLGCVVDGFEAEELALARPRLRLERAAVPERLGGPQQPLHAAELALEREGHL